MAFDLEALSASVQQHGTVHRVVIADIKGSSPREIGASMLVWDGGQSGTIGGGALEFAAAKAARQGQSGITRHALGPALGQCCGGSVTLLTETYDANKLVSIEGDVVVRRIDGSADMPLKLRRSLRSARSEGVPPAPRLVDGWMIEPIAKPARHLWVWGAGHVGRAIVEVLAPLPDLHITWIDTAPERFPKGGPSTPTRLPIANPADIVTHAPPHAEHLILTYSHALDLELCHRLLTHDFTSTGLIGSATKWARFRSRLADLGHSPHQIQRITCPIGDPSLGKHPQAIAIGVAAAFMNRAECRNLSKDQTA